MNTYAKWLLILLPIWACSDDEEPVIPNRPPGNFEVTTLVEGTSVTVSWTPAADPDGDQVRYQVDLEDQTVLENSTATSTVVTNLEFDQAYSGEVMALDPEGLSTIKTFQFSTGVQPNNSPGAFTLTSPADQTSGVVLQPTLQWEPSTDPDGDQISYEVYIGTANPPDMLVIKEISGTTVKLDASLLTEDELKDNSTYYWQIVASDGQGGKTTSDTWSFTTRATVSATLVNDNPLFVDRYSHTSVVFDNKMWIIAGNPGSGGARYSDVWSSTDGDTWTMATGNPDFAGRGAHSSVVFGGKMWIIGGRAGSGAGDEFNDVWYSEDGIDWELATSDADFPPKYGHKSVVYQGKIWVIGGRNNADNISRKEVWSSADGINWTLETGDANFTSGQNFQVVVHKDEMWFTGGRANNVYASTNGIDWKNVNTEAPYGDRFGHASLVHDEKIWVISGANSSNSSIELEDVWYSEDGITWILANDQAGYRASVFMSSVSYDGKIWLVGGSPGSGAIGASSWDDVYYLD